MILLQRRHVHELPLFHLIRTEPNLALNQSEQRVIFPYPAIHPGVPLRPSLSRDDVPRTHDLPVPSLQPQTLPSRISSVRRRPALFFRRESRAYPTQHFVVRLHARRRRAQPEGFDAPFDDRRARARRDARARASEHEPRSRVRAFARSRDRRNARVHVRSVDDASTTECRDERASYDRHACAIVRSNPSNPSIDRSTRIHRSIDRIESIDRSNPSIDRSIDRIESIDRSTRSTRPRDGRRGGVRLESVLHERT